MVLHLQVQNIQSQSPILNLVALFCEENQFDEEEHHSEERNQNGVIKNVKKTSPLLECDLFWEDDEVDTLLSKENENLLDCNGLVSDGFLVGVRKESLEWMLSVIEHYGFTSLTAVLAVNYFDRFICGVCFQKDKPWMSHLVAVACLSIAAKVEEVQVPLLLDLQVANPKYVFEAKTIQRMEILVLSTLKWKMNPVPPLSFIDHSMRRYGLMTNLHLEFQRKCENLILGIITDSRLLHYPPSIIATSTMFYVINEIEPCNAVDYLNQLMGVLKVRKDKIDECHDLILELMGIPGSKICQSLKRKCQSLPGSPKMALLMHILAVKALMILGSWNHQFPPYQNLSIREAEHRINKLHWYNQVLCLWFWITVFTELTSATLSNSRMVLYGHSFGMPS